MSVQAIKSRLLVAAREYAEVRGADPIVCTLFGIAVELCNRVEAARSELAELQELSEWQRDQIGKLQLALEESEADVMRLERLAKAANAA